MEKKTTNVADQPLDLFATSLTVLLCAIWGGAFVGIKISTLDMPVIGSGAIRFGLTAVVLLLWAFYQRVPLRYGPAEMKSLAVLTVMFFYINLTAYVGTSWTTAGRATVFFYTQPLFLALLAPYFLPGDQLTSRKLCGLGLALCGIVALFFTKLSGRETSTLAGDIFVLSGALVSAFSGIATKRTAGRIHPVALICWQCWLSWPLLALLSWWLEAGRPFEFTGRAVAAILYLGLISAAFGFVAYAWLLQRNSATRVTALTFLAPVFGVAYSWLIFREAFTPVQLLGVLGVCLGVYVVNSRGASRQSSVAVESTSSGETEPEASS
ncbi:MAG: DMT family transporter [Deltaproteobacteria bacterium]|nr:DMT family transporter [Deltaproteobacteria bacterium]